MVIDYVKEEAFPLTRSIVRQKRERIEIVIPACYLFMLVHNVWLPINE